MSQKIFMNFSRLFQDFMVYSRSWMISYCILFIEYSCFINDFDDFSRFLCVFFLQFILFISPFYHDLSHVFHILECIFLSERRHYVTFHPLGIFGHHWSLLFNVYFHIYFFVYLFVYLKSGGRFTF